jgi:hypothetical protein
LRATGERVEVFPILERGTPMSSPTTGVIDLHDLGSAGRRNRVLVVDEEVALTNLLNLALTFEGWEVETWCCPT